MCGKDWIPFCGGIGSVSYLCNSCCGKRGCEFLMSTRVRVGVLVIVWGYYGGVFESRSSWFLECWSFQRGVKNELDLDFHFKDAKDFCFFSS